MSEWRGLKEFIAALDQVPKALPRRVVLPALRVGARVFRDRIRAEIDKLDISDSGKNTLKRSLRIRVLRSRGQPDVVRVGVFIRTGQRRRDEQGRSLREWDGAWWWLWIEGGTVERERGAGGRMVSTGRIEAQPFVGPAIERAMGAAEEAMYAELERQWDLVLAEVTT